MHAAFIAVKCDALHPTFAACVHQVDDLGALHTMSCTTGQGLLEREMQSMGRLVALSSQQIDFKVRNGSERRPFAWVRLCWDVCRSECPGRPMPRSVPSAS